MYKDLTALEQKIYDMGIVPVVTIEDAAKAVQLADALTEGGLPCAEITFRTAAAADAIAVIRKERPDMLVGAGTVLSVEQLEKAIEAGAQFIVTPGLNTEVVEAAQKADVPIIPGCSRPSDLEIAYTMGLRTVKFFPAEAAGGTAMLKAMSAPYSMMRFMPTGGIDAGNLRQYLDLPCVLACGGTFMIAKDALKNNDFEGIRVATEKAVRSMLSLKTGHVGMICDDKDDCQQKSAELAEIFGLTCTGNPAGDAFMVGDFFEMLVNNAKGERGHLAITTPNTQRAYAYFCRKGYTFDEETIRYDEKGRMKSVYFKDTWCGFGLHLLQI